MLSPREEHNNRSFEDRTSDEKRSEKYTDNPEKWIKNMNKFDFKCVDDPVPKKIKIEIKNIGRVDPETSKIFSVKKTHSNIQVFKILSNRYHISYVLTDPKYRNKCHASYLMREVVNFADSKCMELSLDACPMEDEKCLNFNSLVKFYSQFGFKKVPEGFTIKGISQDMFREARC